MNKLRKNNKWKLKIMIEKWGNGWQAMNAWMIMTENE